MTKEETQRDVKLDVTANDEDDDGNGTDGGDSSSELSEGESVGMGECASECGRVFRPRKSFAVCIIMWYLVLNVAKCILIHVSPFCVVDVMVISYR